MHTKKLRAVALVAASMLAVIASGCSGSADGSGGSAGNFKPRGNVTMIVPFAPGGGSDISGRSAAAGLADVSGLTISVKNIEGGSGAVGYSQFLADSGKDNVLLASETALLALPLTQKVKFSYQSFTPIMKLGDDYTLIAVRPDAPYKTCKDLTDAARKKQISVAISGKTGLDNVVFSLMAKKTGAKFNKVPFESGAESITALLGGNVQAISNNPGEIMGQLKSGKLRALCAASDQRYSNSELKDIPTAKEQGIDVSFAQFRGVIAPADISPKAKAYWIAEAKKFAKSKAYKDYINKNVMQAKPLYGDEFTKYLASNNSLLQQAIG